MGRKVILDDWDFEEMEEKIDYLEKENEKLNKIVKKYPKHKITVVYTEFFGKAEYVSIDAKDDEQTVIDKIIKGKLSEYSELVNYVDIAKTKYNELANLSLYDRIFNWPCKK